jgi:hypothetical protein
MRNSFIYLIFLSALVSCRHSADDVSGAESMAGKVYVLNPYDSFPAMALASQTVLLQRETDVSPASFMFSTVTNSSGEFSLNFLYPNTTYKLHTEMRRNTRWDNDILFTADTTTRPGKNIQLFLQPDTVKQNGLFVICLDSVTTTTAGVIPADSIYVYTSSVLAIEDSSRITGSGASCRFVSNMDGKALKMNLPFDRPLYLNAACTYGGKRYAGRYAITRLRKTGVDTVRIRMRN